MSATLNPKVAALRDKVEEHGKELAEMRGSLNQLNNIVNSSVRQSIWQLIALIVSLCLSIAGGLASGKYDRQAIGISGDYDRPAIRSVREAL
jgi:hypothetical protein